MMIIPINPEFRPKVNQHIAEEWSGPIVVTKGVAHDTTNSEGYLFVTDGELTGYLLYRIQGKECEILVLQALLENHGVGTSLLNTAMETARKNSCTRVWLVTTNDNIHAIRYYQKFGFALKAVHINALDVSRKLKPSIPLRGNEGIPIQHEFEFEINLTEKRA